MLHSFFQMVADEQVDIPDPVPDVFRDVELPGIHRELEEDDMDLPGVQGKYWVFTLNNPTEDEWFLLSSLSANQGGVCTYLVLGDEVGVRGTPHVQGYLELPGKLRRSAVSKMDGLARAWLARRLGTSQQASAYCKKGGSFIEWGALSHPEPGRRTDLEHCREMILAGASDLELANAHFAAWCGNDFAFKRYRNLIHEDVDRLDLKVIVIWGPTRTGKTRYAHWKARQAGAKLFKVPCREVRWFDGYDGHRFVAFDDFDMSVDPGKMKELLDIYPQQVPVKNGFAQFIPTTIFITSNFDPAEWYVGRPDRDAVMERLHVIVHLTERNTLPEVTDTLVFPGEREEQ